jgi:hypothetical protein
MPHSTSLNRLGQVYSYLKQVSKDKVVFPKEVIGKTVKIEFTPADENVITVDSVVVYFCYEEGNQS